nr:MAG TPA: hypothetical protein [Caudoviricetes sp.]
MPGALFYAQNHISASYRQVKFTPKYRILTRFFLLTAYLGKLQIFSKNMARIWQEYGKNTANIG